MHLKSASNPRWGDEKKTFIFIDADWAELGIGPISYMAAPFDCEPHGRQLFERAVEDKEFGPIGPYVATPASEVSFNPAVAPVAPPPENRERKKKTAAKKS